ncbi:hypothetical protein SAMN05444273_104255 [Litoreibacter ascidiaceicola]|uniref:Uncharacterized protein n=1 Tax=Litoreibacter ascidiaceicola TaxID=1486859 RepID=A0A1M4ZN70_9RHOB|nr:hypothetical protein [Litoreibacter ascidiaceicola]SHF19483.1 hypothetical protein SAMN05444273_104255 [Litoreibacter ascidiaceicola]
MTALKEYDRLESTGIWRESPDAQRRDVLISFGDATLIIRDKTDTALAHWSLPAIERLNPGARPALFRPGPDAGEELELEDGTLIDAIEKVRRTVARRRPHRGRLRLYIFTGLVAAIGALGFFWLPGALVRHTVTVVPESKRLAIGTALLGHMTRLTGDTCRSNLGTAALARLKARVLGDGLRKAYVVPSGPEGALSLPGGLLLLNRMVVEDHDAADVAAGYMLAASEQARMIDPMELLLKEAGGAATLHLLTSGQIEDDVLRDYAETLLSTEPPALNTDVLLDRFATAKVAASPYAYAVDVTGESTIDLIEADPYRGIEAPRLISDGDWISLQEICAE